jgi:hypothetical protein
MDLLWTVRPELVYKNSYNTCAPAPFPSWSWAAASSKISWYNFPDAITTMEPLSARVCLESTAAPFGLVKSATLRIKAYLRPIHTISLWELPNELSPGIIERFLVARFPAPTFTWPDDWDEFMRLAPEEAPQLLKGCYLLEIFRLDSVKYKGQWLPSAGLVVAPVNTERTLFVRKGVFSMPGIPKGAPEYPWQIDESMKGRHGIFVRQRDSPFLHCKRVEIDLM